MLPPQIDTFRPLAVYTFGMALYAIFIFKFYRFVARKDIFTINLKKYNTSKFPALRKAVSLLFYLIKYVLLFPVFAFFWMALLTLFLVFLSQEQALSTVLLISVSIVSAARITSYYDEDLSRDLAKMLPFTLLGVFVINTSFIKWEQSVGVLHQLPEQLPLILHYFIFIVLLEFVLRILHSMFRKRKKDDKEKADA